MVKEKAKAVKEHIVRNKAAYIFGGSGILVGAGFTLLIMRGRCAGIRGVPDTAENSVFVRPFNFLSPNTIVTVIERDGRGHPGYIVRCIETGAIFPSQVQAAKEMNVPVTVLSAHLNGKFSEVDGLHFERIAA